MTVISEISAVNAGVRAVLDAARQTAQALRDEPGWKPTREGAADALDELAAAGAGGSVAPIPAGPRSPNGPASSALEIAHGA